MIDVLVIMPQKDGSIIDHDVGRLLFNQRGVTINFMTITRLPEYYDFSDVVAKMPSESAVRMLKGMRPDRKGITAVRNLLADKLKERPEKYVLHLDYDVRFSSDHDVRDMVEFLEYHPEHAGVALNTKNMQIRPSAALLHIPLACMLLRREDLDGYHFSNGEDNRHCNCLVLFRDFKSQGKSIVYLDDRQLSEVLTVVGINS